ncbi:MAG: hypothetical protein ABW056_05725, partial [Thermoanaerobaculia bacterium]
MTDLRNHRVTFAFLVASIVFLAGAPPPAAADDWLQWGRTPQHRGVSPVQGQIPEVILDSVVYDPFVEAMKEETGFLLAHYSVPLIRDGAIYMVFKTGAYTGLGNFDSLTWNVKKLEWINGRLEAVWTFETDWKPEPLDLTAWEAVLQPAISGHDIYVPGLGGTVHRVATETGISEGRVNPFSDVDPTRYVAGGLGVGPDGSVFYNVIDLPNGEGDAEGAWLVKVIHEGDASRVDYSTLVTGAPAPNSQCQAQFPGDQRPWPPTPDAVAPTVDCGSQRPGINVVPAIAEDGTIYTLSRAHHSDRYSYLVAVHPDLTPAWKASFRGILDDGCGVLVRIDDTDRGCRTGAHLGVDPATNDQPAGRVRDSGTSSPVVLPDGNVIIGVSTGYNFARGHLLKFNPQGGVLATYDFGWDLTPAVFEHDGTYSILIKDNHYSDPDGIASYDVTSLDANLEPEWSFLATNTESCVRQPSGGVECVDDHPEGFEWCVNQPAIDVDGTAYLNGEDGVLYAFDREGHVIGSVFLDTALGAAYTPLSIGPGGIIYTQNNGVLFAVGAAPREPRA